MKVTFLIGLMVSAVLFLTKPSLFSDSYKPAGTITGTVTLSENSSVVRSGRRGPYGSKRANRANKDAEQESAGTVLIWLEGSSSVGKREPAENPVLNQQNKSFDPNLMAIRQGDAVRILNSDPVYHNVFSLSKTKKFDVGRRPQGEHMDVVFDEAGKVDVFCDIHSHMHAVIYVMPASVVTWLTNDVDKPFSISGIAPGTYTLRAFSIGFDEFQKSIEITGDESVDLGTISLTK